MSDYRTEISATRGEQFLVARYFCNQLVDRYLTDDLGKLPKRRAAWMEQVACQFGARPVIHTEPGNHACSEANDTLPCELRPQAEGETTTMLDNEKQEENIPEPAPEAPTEAVAEPPAGEPAHGA